MPPAMLTKSESLVAGWGGEGLLYYRANQREMPTSKKDELRLRNCYLGSLTMAMGCPGRR